MVVCHTAANFIQIRTTNLPDCIICPFPLELHWSVCCWEWKVPATAAEQFLFLLFCLFLNAFSFHTHECRPNSCLKSQVTTDILSCSSARQFRTKPQLCDSHVPIQSSSHATACRWPSKRTSLTNLRERWQWKVYFKRKIAWRQSTPKTIHQDGTGKDEILPSESTAQFWFAAPRLQTWLELVCTSTWWDRSCPDRRGWNVLSLIFKKHVWNVHRVNSNENSTTKPFLAPFWTRTYLPIFFQRTSVRLFRLDFCQVFFLFVFVLRDRVVRDVYGNNFPFHQFLRVNAQTLKNKHSSFGTNKESRKLGPVYTRKGVGIKRG